MDLYSAMSLLHTGRSDMDRAFLPANYTMPALIPQPQSITARRPLAGRPTHFTVPRRVEG